jgi:putative PIN family toxin of toxin-antitoxin system
MKCLIDTNILVSAVLFPQSVPAQAYTKSVTKPNIAFVSDYSLDEFQRIMNRKFAHKLEQYYKFVSNMLTVVKVLPTPADEVEDESGLRDVNDRPILRAAVTAGIDVIITGDKDFLQAKLKHVKVHTAAEFLQLKKE